jgi:hypothetical protein
VIAAVLAALLSAPVASLSLRADLTADTPTIDGQLDESLWLRAATATGFIQAEPRAGERARRETEVKVAYSRDLLLIGARLYDDEPSRIVASEYQRDAMLQAEDSFEVFLDTFRDSRNAFYFATNAVGARLDGLVRAEGAALNFEWDGVWDVAARVDADGWVVEMAIPFNTLRFNSESDAAWGVNFGRVVARTREESYWSPISPDWGFNAKYRVSSYGELTGITEADPGGRVKLKPYGLAGGEHDFEEDDRDLETKVGLDAKLGLSSALNLDLTLNTDFAQVESDLQQVNLTRFPLFYPEKREFFLENAGLFRVGEVTRPFEPAATLLFFSRQIGLSEDGDEIPILGGARLTGRLGRTELGAFHIITDETPLEEQIVPRTSFSALRVKQDVFARSSLGAMLLSKSPASEGDIADGGGNHVGTLDFNFAVSENTDLQAFYAKSDTPGLPGSDHALGAHASWVTDLWSIYGDYADIGEDFNSEMGFVPRTGIYKYRVNSFWSPRPRALGLRQIYIGNDYTLILDREGDLETELNSLSTWAVFESGAVVFADWLYEAEGLTEPFEIRDDVDIPIGDYAFHRFNVGYMGDRSRRVSLNANYSGGGFYDGTLETYSLGVETKLHPRLRASALYSRNDVELPLEGGDFTTNLVVLRGVFAFSPDAFVRALVQYNDDSEEALANVLFRYNYRDGSDLFIVYNEERDILGSSYLPRHRELQVKVTFYAVPF